jgi:hypothetical protein
LRVLTVAAIRQLDAKLSEAVRAKYAEITLVVEEGRLRWIRGPAVSEPVALTPDPSPRGRGGRDGSG